MHIHYLFPRNVKFNLKPDVPSKLHFCGLILQLAQVKEIFPHQIFMAYHVKRSDKRGSYFLDLSLNPNTA